VDPGGGRITRPELIESVSLSRRIAAFGLPLDGEPAEVSISEESWPLILGRLYDERLTGLAVVSAEEGWLNLSSGQAEELLDRHRRAMLQALGLERILVTLATGFEGAGIEVLVIKGPALAHTVYPDPSWRPFADVDLLVRTKDWQGACALLEDGGFRRNLPAPRARFDERFGKAAEYTGRDGLTVDLHRTLVVGPFGLWMNPDDLFERTATFSLGGRLLRRLDDSALLLHQCMHASLGWWPPLLMPVRDVAQVASAPGLDWMLVAERARRWRLAAVVRHAFETVSETLGVPVPKEAGPVMAIRPRRTELRALDAYITDRRGRGGTALSTLRAIRGLRQKAAYVRALLVPSREFLGARQRNKRPSYLRRLAVPVRWLAGGRRRT
jgi:hypothetical protein